MINFLPIFGNRTRHNSGICRRTEPCVRPLVVYCTPTKKGQLWSGGAREGEMRDTNGRGGGRTSATRRERQSATRRQPLRDAPPCPRVRHVVAERRASFCLAVEAVADAVARQSQQGDAGRGGSRSGTEAAPRRHRRSEGVAARGSETSRSTPQRAGRDEPRGRTHEPSAGSSSAGGRPSVDAKLVGLERMGGERGVEECGARDEALRGVE